jgi:hypothetical protein
VTLECQAPSCGRKFTAARSYAKYCSDACRRRTNKAKKAGVVIPMAEASPPPRPKADGVVAASRRELEDAGRAESSLGQAALAAAARIDSNHETGSAMAALLREHRAIMAEALKGAPRATFVDELKARRDRRLSG